MQRMTRRNGYVSGTLSTLDDADCRVRFQKVTLTTCHAAKGLEWPVVFVPACENGESTLLQISIGD
jgi:superfamily I DNA/RNA helicase